MFRPDGQAGGGAGIVACPLSLRGFRTINAVPPSVSSMYSLSLEMDFGAKIQILYGALKSNLLLLLN